MGKQLKKVTGRKFCNLDFTLKIVEGRIYAGCAFDWSNLSFPVVHVGFMELRGPKDRHLLFLFVKWTL